MKFNNYQPPLFLKAKGKNNDIFLLIVEGINTEKIYFEKLKSFSGRNSNIRIKIESSCGGDIEKMLKIARQQIKESKNKRDIRNVPLKKVFIVIDRDRFSNNVTHGVGLQHLKNGLNSIAKKEPIEIVLSSPSFEYWYLLHFCDKKPSNYDKVKEMLERFLKDTNILNEHQLYSKNEDETKRMLDKFFQNTDIAIAIKNAEKISSQYDNDGNDRFDRDPYTEVYNLVKILELDKINKLK